MTREEELEIMHKWHKHNAALTLNSAPGQWVIITVRSGPGPRLSIMCTDSAPGMPDQLSVDYEDIYEVRMNYRFETCPNCGDDEKLVGEQCFAGRCLVKKVRAVFHDLDMLANVESQLSKAGYETQLRYFGDGI